MWRVLLQRRVLLLLLAWVMMLRWPVRTLLP